MSRPNRSDTHLPLEEEAKKEAEAREYFEGIAPKRHTKPSRSEYSAVYSDALLQISSAYDLQASVIPELDKFRQLEAHPEKLECDGNTTTAEEFVEIHYYEDLNSIDKQHHTTGTGFIKMENSNGNNFEIHDDPSGCHASGKGNPATNEWIPSADTVIPESRKPKEE